VLRRAEFKLQEAKKSMTSSLFSAVTERSRLYKRDREYVVENGEIVIVDEFTGRKITAALF